MNVIIKIGVWSVTMLVASLMVVSECRAAVSDSLVYSLYFRQGDDLLLKDYRGNEKSIALISQLMTAENIARISHIKIIGATSPEGTVERNKKLTEQRAKAIRNYILWRWKNLPIKTIQITEHNNVENAWLLAVEADAQVPNRDRVIRIIKKKSSISTKWANIQLLSKESADYMERNIFPQLRNVVACVIRFDLVENKDIEASIVITRDSVLIVTDTKQEVLIENVVEVICAHKDTTSCNKLDVAECITAITTKEVEEHFVVKKPNKPLFAMKTNLLFDVATILNLEIEIPIGKRFSVTVEGMFPWWLWEGKQNCIQLVSGNVEGRFWFGDRKNKPVLTGWYAGLYAGGGYYDLELRSRGYQGEFFIAAGISGGFAHTINKKGTLRMEYGLGVGYMSTNYRRYEAKFSNVDNSWHLYRQEAGHFSWLGPTRAKVSLVWMLDTDLFKKKGARK